MKQYLHNFSALELEKNGLSIPIHKKGIYDLEHTDSLMVRAVAAVRIVQSRNFFLRASLLFEKYPALSALLIAGSEHLGDSLVDMFTVQMDASLDVTAAKKEKSRIERDIATIRSANGSGSNRDNNFAVRSCMSVVGIRNGSEHETFTWCRGNKDAFIKALLEHIPFHEAESALLHSSIQPSGAGVKGQKKGSSMSRL